MNQEEMEENNDFICLSTHVCYYRMTNYMDSKVISNMSTFDRYTNTKLVAQQEKYIIYRGYARTNSSYVLVKALTSASPHINDITKLIHEYEISKGISHEGFVKSISLEKQGSVLALTMEDFDSIPSQRIFNRSLYPFKCFFRLPFSSAKLSTSFIISINLFTKIFIPVIF